MAKKEEVSLIHLRFDISEARQAKRDLLALQLSILQTAKALKNYKKLRIDELRKKEKIEVKIKTIKTDITRLKRILPKIKIPKILQNNKEEPASAKIKKVFITSPEIKRYGTIEDQLLKIQEKLRLLE